MIELKNGAQIPESSIVQQITAALDGFYAPDTLGLVQYDDTMPVVAVQLTVNNQPYAPGESAQLNYRMGKPWPDTHAIYNPCLGVDEEGVIYFSITAQCTTTPGKTTLTVEVTDSGVKNSAPIQVVIAKNPAPKDTIESTDEFLTMQEILAKVQALEKTTTAAATSAAADKVAAQAARKGAEDAEARVQAIVAGNESYTKQETHDRFALALQGTADPAASITIYPDAGSNVAATAHGFTIQEGSGDASPENQRPIVNGGLKLVKYVVTGDENFAGVTNGYCNVPISIPATYISRDGKAFCNMLPYIYDTSQKGFYLSTANTITLNIPFMKLSDGTVSGTKAYCKKLYEAGTPLIFWYFPADESQATGLYAPLTGTGEGHTGACGELTANLCQGDKLITKVKSGCDKVVTLDGSEDENWELSYSAGSRNTFSCRSIFSGMDKNNGKVYADWLTYRDAYDDFTTFTGMYYSNNLQFNIINTAVPVNSLESWKSYLAGHPLTVWYRSTNYTEDADIPVSLETHTRLVMTFGKNTVFGKSNLTEKGYFYFGQYNYPTAHAENAFECSHYTPRSGASFYNTDYSSTLSIKNSSVVGASFTDFSVDTAAEFNAKLTQFEEAGTPVTIVYELATPITYAHEPVDFIANPGEDGAWVITGEANGKVSAVFNKSLTHTIAELQAAMVAMGAQLSM